MVHQKFPFGPTRDQVFDKGGHPRWPRGTAAGLNDTGDFCQHVLLVGPSYSACHNQRLQSMLLSLSISMRRLECRNSTVWADFRIIWCLNVSCTASPLRVFYLDLIGWQSPGVDACLKFKGRQMKAHEPHLHTWQSVFSSLLMEIALKLQVSQNILVVKTTFLHNFMDIGHF